MMEGRGVFFLLCCAAILSLGGAQTGFINIDCGLTETPSYNNVPVDNLTYVSDDGYVETGVNMPLAPNAIDGEANKVYKTVRSFPNATRSCYHLPATVGSKYLLRAAFMYGNYDGLNSPPSFRLYFGVDSWETVTLANATHVVRSELVTQAVASVLYVCLVKTGGGTPFISSLKLRPLPNSLYAPANSSIALTTFRRVDVGATKSTWYPADRFDRIWESDYDSYGSPKSTNATVIEYMNLSFGIPSAVLQTAVYSTGEITLGWPGGDGSAFFLVLEFADVVPPVSGKPRHLTIQLNGQYWIDVNVSYLSSSVNYTRSVLSLDQYSFTIRSTNASDEGAVLNSFEIYKVLPLSGSATNADDVSAIMAIKEYYQLKKYWVADPCLPQNSPWDGLTCDNSPIPRIVTLDLSNNGLDGKISGHISKLTALKTLNLSTNNLNGQVPAFLQDLPNLTKILVEQPPVWANTCQVAGKKEDGELMLSIENNPLICQQDDCSQDGKSTHKSRTVIVISFVISLLVAIIIIVAVIGTLKRRNLHPTPFNRKRRNEDNHPQQQRVMGYKKSGTFTYSEVVAMTNNFEKVIGKGGSGTVYYGQLKYGREVAVKKVTGLVGQGTNEFQVEVNLLMQIHHKHLAPFIGCCDNDKQMVLIYDYMANGNLRQRLSDETADALNWQQRLHIGLGSAMGLQYLHSGCIPAIIHRDVKSSNILLNENFEAKIADFGLSKSVISSEVTHITTAVAGTIGYLDPEYWYTGRLTKKSDVYGFGIVLFELITGRHAISTHEGESVPIVKIVVPKLLRGEIKSIIDPRLQGQYEISSIWKVADTAMSCTEEKSFIRPTMTDVVAELKDAMEIEMARERSGGSRMWKSSRHSFSGNKAPIRSNSLSDTDPDIYPSAR